MLALLVLVTGFSLPVQAAATAAPVKNVQAAADSSAYRCSLDLADWLKPHPTQAGENCYPGTGWGRLAPSRPRNVVVTFTTPTYTTSTSFLRVCEIEAYLSGEPVSPRLQSSVPTWYGVQSRVMTSGCDPATGRVNLAKVKRVRVFPDGYRGVLENVCYDLDATGKILKKYDNPCRHVNYWRVGPKGGVSTCDKLKICETYGHANQNGYDDFYAHYEIWHDYLTQQASEFVPCGARCNPPNCDPATDPACTPPPCDPATDPACTPPPCNPDTDPNCTPPPCETGVDPDCTPPPCNPDTDPDCTPPPCNPDTDPDCTIVICRTGLEPGCPPPPPPFCDTYPTHPSCRSADPVDTRFEVTVRLPDRFSAKGTLLSEGATVIAVELFCGARRCTPAADNAEPAPAGVNGNLVLDASATFKRCPSPKSSGCAFYQTTRDGSVQLAVGDTVAANFFSPTRASEAVIVHTDGVAGRVDLYSLVPVYELVQVECQIGRAGCSSDGFRYQWVLTDRVERTFQRTVEVPVVIRDQAGRVMSAGGFRRTVIGIVGD